MTPYIKKIVELHKIHKAIENCGCNKDDEQGGGDENSGNLLMSLIPSDYPKPDLFLVQGNTEDNFIDVTNYKIDDFLNLYAEQERELHIMCLYENSNFGTPIVSEIYFDIDDSTYFGISSISEGNTRKSQIPYNNKIYYYYERELG